MYSIRSSICSEIYFRGCKVVLAYNHQTPDRIEEYLEWLELSEEIRKMIVTTRGG